ncbi:MAG: hypothetical protein WD824_09005 [Cyclobacteriaceae bacterium]
MFRLIHGWQEGLFMDYLIGYEKIQIYQNQIRKSWIFSSHEEKFVPATDSTFITEGTRKIGMVKAQDPLAGEVLYSDKLILKRTPLIIVIGLLSTVTIWIILMVLGALTWLALCIRSLRKSFDKTFMLCSYVMLTSLMYAIFLLLTKAGYADPDKLLARPWIAVCEPDDNFDFYFY